ncbi:MAG TPA: NAD(P)H-quinone oxidoreductase [Acidobacteriota bacterium]|nr:NAD(P)H-quinone oxidoreductase [Acidobacteriota bacterium]
MKAIVISEPGGPEVLRLREVEEPGLEGDEILVRVSATALNRADCLQRRGLYPAPPDAPADIPGLEFAGQVEALGPRASRFRAGDRVMGLLSGGGYAEKVAVPESQVLDIPEEWSDEEAAAFPEAYFTAYDALFPQLGLKMGELILIHAVGSGVGLAALQLSKAAGAGVLGTAGSRQKLEKARQFGLDEAICYKEQDFAQEVERFTRGKGVQAVLDFVGADYFARNLQVLAPLGRLIIVGLLSGAQCPADLSQILRKRLRVMGTVLRVRDGWEKAQLTERVRQCVLPLAAWGEIVPVLDSIFDLSQAPEAHRRMEANRNFGKIVLRCNG